MPTFVKDIVDRDEYELPLPERAVFPPDTREYFKAAFGEKDFDQLNDDTFCQEFHDDIFNVWPRLKLLLTVSLSPPQIYISIFFRSKLSNIFLKMNKYFTC